MFQMKTSFIKAFALYASLGLASSAFAIPTLQVGVSNGSGGYVAYTAGSNPSEADTAYTSGNSVVVGGAYGSNADTLIGGNYGTGPDWSAFGFSSVFNGHGAVVMASVSVASNSLTLNGLSSFYTTTANLFPNNHAPLGDAASFMFFDIGDFAKIANTVTDFACTSGCTAKTGQLKNLTLGGTGAYDWIHFDVMALVTDAKGQCSLDTTLDNNPGSHDVTWKTPSTNVPEPSTTLLLGLGLMGLLFAHRARSV